MDLVLRDHHDLVVGWWHETLHLLAQFLFLASPYCFESQRVGLRTASCLVKDGGEQYSEWYREINPQAQLPTLELTDGTHLTQSMAIMMYLDRDHPAAPLLPTEHLLYAKFIQLAEIINAGIQPLQNLSVLQFLNTQDPSKELSMSWARGAIQRGLEDLESLVANSTTQFLLTDTPTIAECCLIPQLYNARRFGCDLSKVPRLLEVEQVCEGLDAFQQAHPSVQSDAQ